MNQINYQSEYDVLYPNLLEDRIQSTKNGSCNRAFIEDIEKSFSSSSLNVLDLGCFRGALVEGFLQRNHFAVGVELCRQKEGAWKHLYGKNLFTCDVTQPFSILTKTSERRAFFPHSLQDVKVTQNQEEPLFSEYEQAQFDVAIAINLANLIHPDKLPIFFQNVRKALKIGGILVGSISLADHFPQNQELMAWQNYRLRTFEGLQFSPYPFEHIPYPIFESFYYVLVRTF